MTKPLITFYFLSVLIFSGNKIFAQDTTAKIVFSGYVDVYYALYSDNVGINNYQKFPSVDPRSNSFGLNTAILTAQYDADKVRGIVSLHYGDIAKSAWSPEFNNIFEAHAGVKLSKKVWLDAGFFRTHFGTEGLLPRENIASAVSVNTFYEPYYESGIRLNYNPSEKLSLNFYVLNGYNIFEENNEKKSLGLQATYTLKNGSIGYCNYIGDDSPDAYHISRIRINQNLFYNYQKEKIKIQAGIDFCLQKNSSRPNYQKTASMVSGVMGFKYQTNNKSAVYTRGEIFRDPDGFMSGWIRNGYGLNLWGITLGTEYKPTVNSYIRLEGRELITDKNRQIFFYKGKYRNNRGEILFNIGVSF